MDWVHEDEAFGIIFYIYTFIATHLCSDDTQSEDQSPPPSSAQPPRPTPETPKKQERESFVPGLYYADPNPEHSFGDDELDFIPLPTSSPIKFLPTQRKEGQSDIDNYPSNEENEESPDPMQLKAEVSKDPPLSILQKKVLDRVLRGESVFFTGSAGESIEK